MVHLYGTSSGAMWGVNCCMIAHVLWRASYGVTRVAGRHSCGRPLMWRVPCGTTPVSHRASPVVAGAWTIGVLPTVGARRWARSPVVGVSARATGGTAAAWVDKARIWKFDYRAAALHKNSGGEDVSDYRCQRHHQGCCRRRRSWGPRVVVPASSRGRASATEK